MSPQRKSVSLITEILAGDLLTLMNTNRLPNRKMRMNFVLDVARGLAFLHKHKIIHRDMKCNNILVDDHLFFSAKAPIDR